ncbi:COLI1 protein, partial [Tricholaema leucomelas]|nr:COLI1 protein [Tricholaema leucomelas]
MSSALWSILPVVLWLLLWHPISASGPCWESGKCQDLTNEAGILACASACRWQLSAEAPVYPGNGHLQPLSESIRRYVMSHFRWNKFGWRNSSAGLHRREQAAGDSPPPASLPAVPPPCHDEEEGTGLGREEGKRSYSMEHFRWGKPVGRKRRPVKVYPNGVEEESAESYPLEFRRELVLGTGAPPEEEEEEEEEEEGQEEKEKASGSSYRVRHFRWHTPSKDKRYGGFMTSEHNQTPLVTLFKNAIIKSAYKKGQ